jgi:hypothetical protein
VRTSHVSARPAVRARVGLLGATAVALGVLAVSTGVASAAGPFVCSGSFGKPGLLTGNYPNGAVVKGNCATKAGRARVFGTLLVTKGSALAAAWGLNHRTHKGGSSLTVTGNLVINQGATVVLGCKVNANGSGFPCLDDPHPNHPTLSSSVRVSGSVIENSPLGVIVHNSLIGGNIKETGGGGGLSCAPPKRGPFAKLMSPIYSDYEDSSVAGNLAIRSLKSCYLGVIRDHVHGNLSFVNNKLGDPDAIEIEANVVGKNLSCFGKSSVWNSHETSMTSNFPRAPQPNTVHGKRSGQCVLSTPITMGGPSGPGLF